MLFVCDVPARAMMKVLYAWLVNRHYTANVLIRLLLWFFHLPRLRAS
jgi:short-subunit dehydrogenase involved in D-alanine esterification of teichoic acids